MGDDSEDVLAGLEGELPEFVPGDVWRVPRRQFTTLATTNVIRGSRLRMLDTAAPCAQIAGYGRGADGSQAGVLCASRMSGVAPDGAVGSALSRLLGGITVSIALRVHADPL